MNNQNENFVDVKVDQDICCLAFSICFFSRFSNENEEKEDKEQQQQQDKARRNNSKILIEIAFS